MKSLWSIRGYMKSDKIRKADLRIELDLDPPPEEILQRYETGWEEHLFRMDEILWLMCRHEPVRDSLKGQVLLNQGWQKEMRCQLRQREMFY